MVRPLQISGKVDRGVGELSPPLKFELCYRKIEVFLGGKTSKEVTRSQLYTRYVTIVIRPSGGKKSGVADRTHRGRPRYVA